MQPPSERRSRPAAAADAIGRILRRLSRPLCSAGVLLGTLLFAASLTPSLIPRTPLTQGLLAGACLAAGYAIGVMLRGLWEYLELPTPRSRVLGQIRMAIHVACVLLFLWALWRAPYWQNLVRQVFQMQPTGYASSLEVGAIALVLFAALLAGWRLLRALTERFVGVLAKMLPRRVANLLGILGVVVLVLTLSNGLIVRVALHTIDASFRQADALIPPDTQPPQAWDSTGSPSSLIAWERLGRMGRRFVSSVPEPADIAAFADAPAMAPLRVYAGLTTAPSAEERAQLALDELKRVGGFSRAVLIIITPTGTGWVDPGAIESIEYLYRGDVASVAMQYSYLSSPLSLIVEPDYGQETSQALFRAVYGYWRTLPREQRPRLFLQGLSLGAMNSERSLEWFDVLGDPPHGALWSGPPFAAQQWRALTRARNAGSPAWLPQFRDGSFVRFMNQHGSPVPSDAPWGVMRVVYLQYASDAVSFFDYRDAFRTPAWMYPTRGPDVSPRMRWYPLVSMMQVAVDMLLAGGAPMGYGHVFAPSHYVDAWLQVSGVAGWSPANLARLKHELDQRRAAELKRDEELGGG